MKVECPHCHKPIELVGAKELKEEFALGPNSVQHARERGRFPVPWLSFANRNMFLRKDVETFVQDRSRAKVGSTVGEIKDALDRLPADEREEAKKLLGEAIGVKPRKRT